jgi:SAM-dependent methyltransferase
MQKSPGLVSNAKACRICSNAWANRLHTAREMMFGFREEFVYLECGRCGCLQLLTLPPDMGKYYPPNYYSYQGHSALKAALRRHWSAYAFGRFAPVGWLLSKLFFPNLPMMAVRRLAPSVESRILDVGCGSGALLQDMSHLGFRSLTGADPFIAEDLAFPGGVKILKRELGQLRDEFDLIMLHHSFEHMERPWAMMGEIARLLAPDGTVMLRIPVASSAAWKRYGVNWFGLDAPRHIYLHTASSVKILAEGAGLETVKAWQETDEQVFFASEAYQQDIPMADKRFPRRNVFDRLLKWDQTRRYRREAEQADQRLEGDAVCFLLRRTA